MIQGIFHVSFTVRNLEESVKWYTEVLGLEYFRGQEQHNEYTAKLVAFPNAHLKVAQLHVRANRWLREQIITSNWSNTSIRAARTTSTSRPTTTATGTGHSSWTIFIQSLHA